MKLLTVAAIAILTATSAAAQYSQSAPLPPQTGQNRSDNQRDQDRLKAETSKRQPAAPSREQVLHDTAALTKSLNLSCEVADAKLLAQGTASVNGKQVQVHTYETACSNGVGYFLVDQSPEPSFGFSCFSADSTRTADLAAGREPQPACTLPANEDAKRAAGIVLGKLGQTCAVTALRSIGRDTKANTELTEAACTGGSGFVIASPLPGATQAVSAQNCPDSYRRGIACKLSSNGAPMITMDTFKQALTQHGVVCTVQDTKLIGKQNASKRHVVEFKCAEKPDGLVAFIPLEDATAPFEAMSCSEAGFKAHVICSLTQIH